MLPGGVPAPPCGSAVSVAAVRARETLLSCAAALLALPATVGAATVAERDVTLRPSGKRAHVAVEVRSGQGAPLVSVIARVGERSMRDVVSISPKAKGLAVRRFGRDRLVVTIAVLPSATIGWVWVNLLLTPTRLTDDPITRGAAERAVERALAARYPTLHSQAGPVAVDRAATSATCPDASRFLSARLAERPCMHVRIDSNDGASTSWQGTATVEMRRDGLHVRLQRFVCSLRCPPGAAGQPPV